MEVWAAQLREGCEGMATKTPEDGKYKVGDKIIAKFALL